MKSYIAVWGAALLSTVIATPLAMRVAYRYGLVDVPDNDLKPHQRPVPYLGGVAIFVGFMVSLLLSGLRAGGEGRLSIVVLIFTLCVMLYGLLDDMFNIRQTYKFFSQIFIGISFAVLGLQVGTLPHYLVAVLFTAFYIVGACNALNLLDGLDGLASGNTAIAATFFFVLFGLKGDELGMILSAGICGACIGFLVYNSEPAKVFMGDAGSMLLGFVLAVLMIRYTREPYDLMELLCPVFVCGVPIFDTGLTYARRYLNKKPIFPGDRSHFYDQLVDRGVSVRMTVRISYGLGVAFGAIGLSMVLLPKVAGLVIAGTCFSALGFVVWKMKMLKM
jgi:UDP-GlcNAc:undecaprenyl-phosphate GlcNAc-1-phosphate transferase